MVDRLSKISRDEVQGHEFEKKTKSSDIFNVDQKSKAIKIVTWPLYSLRTLNNK